MIGAVRGPRLVGDAVALAFQRGGAAADLGHLPRQVGGAARQVGDLRAEVGAVAQPCG